MVFAKYNMSCRKCVSSLFVLDPFDFPRLQGDWLALRASLCRAPVTPLGLYRRHHPTHSAQELPARRSYGWYSNKMRGRRANQTDEEVQTEGDAGEAIDIVATSRAASLPRSGAS